MYYLTPETAKKMTEDEAGEMFKKLFEDQTTLCEARGWGDPNSYARGREIYVACVLGHTVADDYSGADAYDHQGPAEYKSTIGKKVKGSYTGISVHPTWKEQLLYLENKKIACYPNHYYNRFVGGTLAEVYTLPGKAVLDLLVPKLQKKYDPNNLRKKKDPRLSADISYTDLMNHGTKVL